MPKKPVRAQYFDSIRDGKMDTLRWCLRHGGMSVRTEDNDGHTALQLAAAGGKLEVMDLMIETIQKVGTPDDFEAADEEGRTPLMMAAHNGKLECVHRLVLRAKVPLGTKCDKDKTARDYAKGRKHDRVVAFLDNPKEPKKEEPKEEEEEEEVAKKRVFAASNKLDAEKNRQEEVHRARVAAAEELQAHLEGAPAAQWEEVGSVLAETRRELSIRGKPALPGVVVDPALWKCVCLFELRLELADGALTDLPPQLGELVELTTLILSGNRLRSLPDALGSLKKLRNL